MVKRDIVVQELTEEGHAGRHVGIVGIIRTEYTGSVIDFMGSVRLSKASIRPPFLPSFWACAHTASVGLAKGGKSGNMRVKELSGEAGRSRKPGRLKLFSLQQVEPQ